MKTTERKIIDACVKILNRFAKKNREEKEKVQSPEITYQIPKRLVVPAVVQKEIDGQVKYMFQYNGIDIDYIHERCDGESKSLIFDTLDEIDHYKDEYLRVMSLPDDRRYTNYLGTSDEIFVAFDIKNAIDEIDDYLSHKDEYDKKFKDAEQYVNRYFRCVDDYSIDYYKVTGITREMYVDYQLYCESIDYFKTKDVMTLNYTIDMNFDVYDDYTEITEEEYNKHLNKVKQIFE